MTLDFIGQFIDNALMHPIRTIKKFGPLLLLLFIIGAVGNICDGGKAKNETQTAQTQQTYPFLYVGTDALNMRSAPHSEAGVVTLLHKDDKVLIVESASSSNWLKVRFGEYEGYVNGNYLRK
jgi:hypothetical protein